MHVPTKSNTHNKIYMLVTSTLLSKCSVNSSVKFSLKDVFLFLKRSPHPSHHLSTRMSGSRGGMPGPDILHCGPSWIYGWGKAEDCSPHPGFKKQTSVLSAKLLSTAGVICGWGLGSPWWFCHPHQLLKSQPNSWASWFQFTCLAKPPWRPWPQGNFGQSLPNLDSACQMSRIFSLIIEVKSGLFIILHRL